MAGQGAVTLRVQILLPAHHSAWSGSGFELDVERFIEAFASEGRNAEMQMRTTAVPGISRHTDECTGADRLPFFNKYAFIVEMQVLADGAVAVSDPDVICGGLTCYAVIG